MNHIHRIAVLEDNAALREDICFLLQSEGFEVTEFGTAADFLLAHAENSFVVLLLDLGLPDQDGINVARMLAHNRDDIGIIMLTARDNLRDRVNGLMAGADAYLSKPFELTELLAHISVLIRRKSYKRNRVCWRLEQSVQQLSAPNMRCSIDLTSSEMLIMRLLVHHHPEYVSRAELISGLGEDYRTYDERRLEQIMSRLRKKIREGSDSSPIKAVRGRGYVFSESIEFVGQYSGNNVAYK